MKYFRLPKPFAASLSEPAPKTSMAHATTTITAMNTSMAITTSLFFLLTALPPHTAIRKFPKQSCTATR